MSTVGIRTITVEPSRREHSLNQVKLTHVPDNHSGDGKEIKDDLLITDPKILRTKFNPGVTKEALTKKYDLKPFIEATLSKSQVEVIELDAIDFSQYKEGPEGLKSRQILAKKLEESVSTYGFFNITNWGFDTEKLQYLRSVAKAVLDIPHEEKLKYLAGAEQTDLEDRVKSLGGERGAGFKPRQYWSMSQGVRDAIELYNFRELCQDDFLFDPVRKYPQIVRDFLPEVSEYYKFIHFNVLRKLCTLCDIILEKPEGYLWENHFKVLKNDLINSGAGYGRFMHYLGMNKEDENKTGKTWLRGHSDGTAFSFITSQPILSLQIRDYYTGKWRYVGHRPNSLIVNIGDAMEFITGGYFKSSIHRVIAPPDDQRKFERLVLIYFNTPKLTSVLDPEDLNSPKLKRLGFNKPKEWEKITFADWDEEKARLFGRKDVNDVAGDSPLIVKIFGRGHERWHMSGSRPY